MCKAGTGSLSSAFQILHWSRAEAQHNSLRPKKNIRRFTFAILTDRKESGATMSILDSVLSTGGDAVVNQLANKFGITGEQFNTAVSGLVPALAGGIKEKIAGGDTKLANVFSDPKFTQFAGSPAALAGPGAAETGSQLLTQMFGSSDTTAMISTVAEKAGINSGIVQNMLPMVATLVGSMLSRKIAAGENMSDTLTELADAGQGGIKGAVKSLTSKVFG
jgi:hypothetical protein